MKLDHKKCIFQITDAVKEEKSTASVITAYGAKGKKLGKTAKRDEIYLKVEDDKYFIRVNRKYQVFNPFDADSLKRDKEHVKGTKDQPYVMLNVEKECFDHYMKFIKEQLDVQRKIAQKFVSEKENKVRGTFVMTKANSEVTDVMKDFISEIKDVNP